MADDCRDCQVQHWKEGHKDACGQLVKERNESVAKNEKLLNRNDVVRELFVNILLCIQ
jgi:hypothetical protein